MQVYTETLDPSETKDFSFDWSAQLSAGETVTAQVVTFVTAAGTTSPSNSFSSLISKVWLTGGIHGQRAIYTIRATTSGGKTLEEAFGVDVVDTLVGPVGETDVDRLTREIVEARAQRHNAMLGNAVIDVWRDGRRIRRQVTSLADLNEYICLLEGQLVAAQVAAGVTVTARRRRPIGLLWA